KIKGASMMARLDAAKAADRFEATRRFGDFRQLPMKDAGGMDYTKSLREVSPRNALETIIRHFTDRADQKKEHRDLMDSAQRQLSRAEEQAAKARDFSKAVDKILGDHCRAAGVFPSQIAPMLHSQQIAELRDHGEKLPFLSGDRKEFMEAAQLAERDLQARAAMATRISEQERASEQSSKPIEHAASRAAVAEHRSDHDGFSRGR